MLAWAVVILVDRRGLPGATNGSQRGSEPRTITRRTRILVILYALFGAVIAVLITLRWDDYWVRGTDGPSFSTRSFLGWSNDTGPG